MIATVQSNTIHLSIFTRVRKNVQKPEDSTKSTKGNNNYANNSNKSIMK